MTLGSELRFELKHWDGKAFTSKLLTFEEILTVDRHATDYFLSSCLRILAFRTASGDPVEHHGRWPGSAWRLTHF